MTDQTQFIRPERASDIPAVEALQAAAFGPGAYTRAAFRVREQADHDPGLSFVVEHDGALIASVWLTPVRVGADRGTLLGPLVVQPEYKSMGFGRALMHHCLAAAKHAGCPFVVLVGDAPYYGQFGFVPLSIQRVQMPGPVDPARLLVAELEPGVAARLQGMVVGDAEGRPR
ncbi:Predicted N-acetyltransferase YhbS [Faunimonas pinastri]|uniref:Predicted N-acetyltransferase YhbS n=1 Tax=Faunimonas pinastri TaxID=1855383 RepID=A0A1H9AF46_9HYPH|nr:N-acetyltransferase [Faunimonas pinastri]SEP74578.1 Predicted N-acetyltransferase YhbS [Faunimonas pinastri]